MPPANTTNLPLSDPSSPPIPQAENERLQWGQMYGTSDALTISSAAREHSGLILVLVEDVQTATNLANSVGFFLSGAEIPLISFPDWETLPYDVFSPLPELVSQRLKALYRLPRIDRGVLIVPISTMLQRLPPRSYVEGGSFLYTVGDLLSLNETRNQLEQSGYQCVSQVLSHGEYAVRGSLLDLFPMGSQHPLRVDLFDDEIESIRTFDPETQRSMEKVEQVEILPAREFPMDQDSITRFRQAFRNSFEGDPNGSLIYREVSDGNTPGGLEYYLPLFYEQTATLFDYLPGNLLTVQYEHTREQAESFLKQVEERYEQRRHDHERPLLEPKELFLTSDELANRLKSGRQYDYNARR
jgi:transcription-repair coupling factor (superfamily II helicase)